MAYAMHQALELAGRDLTRERLMDALHSIRNMEIPMLLSGVTISISKDDHGPIKVMQMLKFNGSAWETMGPPISRKHAATMSLDVTGQASLSIADKERGWLRRQTSGSPKAKRIDVHAHSFSPR